MALIGKIIQLKGLSNKGKNRIRDHGDRWCVLAETERVLFSPNANGPWIFIAPEGCNQNDKSSRWIRVSGDQDFVMIVQDDLT